MSQSAGNILVVRGGAIGDFVLTFPVLKALRLQFPKARLSILGYPHIVQLAIAGRLADQVTPIEARALAGFFALNGDLDKTLAAFFSSFHVILSYLYDPDEIFRSNVARCSKAQFIQGPHRPDENSQLHATEVLLQPLEKLAIFDADPTPRLDLDAWPVGGPLETMPNLRPGEANSNFDVGILSSGNSRLLKREGPQISTSKSETGIAWIGIHPGSGSESKNWPEEKWAECLKSLSLKCDWNFLLIGGEVEGNRLTRLATVFRKERVEIAQSWPLAKLASKLRQCRVYVGHDSGISHLAAAVGLEGLVLWGTTNSTVWAPRSERMRILKSEQGLAGLSVGNVLRELEALINQKSNRV